MLILCRCQAMGRSTSKISKGLIISELIMKRRSSGALSVKAEEEEEEEEEEEDYSDLNWSAHQVSWHSP